ncbi:Diaminopimelate epimerase [Mycena sanguinolenta]|uniref:Diaminopimelate epimerase n=1 Tax=Mycena sanguinolenta TaxID=230812 RepID=A0A8H6XB50_9AGAR|nr:Diaminopimelate epimerase [Mycena sanguinolenta]
MDLFGSLKRFFLYPLHLAAKLLNPPASSEFDFEIVNAFTTDPFAGNPAVIVFLHQMLPDEILLKISENFNQPIVAYVSPPTSPTPPRNGCAVFGLRWFGPRNEVHICGHGTLAAADAIFRRLGPDANITTLEFETLSGILKAHRVGDQICMDLPAATTVPTSPQETAVVLDIFSRAVAKPSVNIPYVGYGGPGFENYLFVEVDKSESLREWRPDIDCFAELPSRIDILVVSSASQEPGIAYETRMFAPSLGVREDHACGSAHCLNAPYWAVKAQTGETDGEYTSGKPQHAKAVSARGGDIWAEYFAVEKRVRIRGNVKLVAAGRMAQDSELGGVAV